MPSATQAPSRISFSLFAGTSVLDANQACKLDVPLALARIRSSAAAAFASTAHVLPNYAQLPAQYLPDR